MTEAERKYEELARRMTELKEQMLALATEVHRDRSPSRITDNDDARDHVDSVLSVAERATQVKKQAVAVKFDAERQLDLLAKHLQGPGQTYERAYSDMLETPLGRSMLATLEDAQALATGGPTAAMLDAHRKSLA